MADKSLRRFKVDLDKTESFIANLINVPKERTEKELSFLLMVTAELLDEKSELMEYYLETEVQIDGESFNLYAALERRDYLNSLLTIAESIGSRSNFDLLKKYYLDLDERIENVLSNVLITDTENEEEKIKEESEDNEEDEDTEEK